MKMGGRSHVITCGDFQGIIGTLYYPADQVIRVRISTVKNFAVGSTLSQERNTKRGNFL